MNRPQPSLFENKNLKAYGGELRKKAKHRGQRPLVTVKSGKTASMHIVLRSTKAKGAYSFLKSEKKKKVALFIKEFSKKHGVELLNFANVGNHIHLHVRLLNRQLYKSWIRGLSSGLAMISQGLEGFKKLRDDKQQFWDQRPFSKVITNFKHYLKTSQYVDINSLEALGFLRSAAVELVKYTSRLISVDQFNINQLSTE